MKRFFSFLILVFAVGMAQAQSQNKTSNPNERSNVTKEYDDKGNLIRYDSTYVKSWSSGDSTLSPADLAALQKQMEQMFDGSFFGDSTNNGFGDPFPGGFGDDFFSQFGIQPGDSTRNQMPGYQNSFPDFEEMHRQIMAHFRNFFQNDSVQFGNDSVPEIRFFNDPAEIEKMQKEFEQQFEQYKKDSSKNIGT